MLLVAACGGVFERSSQPNGPSEGAAVTGDPTDVSAEPATAEPATPEPITPKPITPDPESSAAPSDAPSVPPSVDPSASPATGSAAACAGNDDNRKFFASIAAAVEWLVYCPVLPAGWFVDYGRFRLAGGGWLEIAYRGPSGARLELREGAFCDDSDGCVPGGAEAGDAAFGGLTGTFIVADDGRLVVVVDRAVKPSWVVIGSGLDREAFLTFLGAFALVEG